MSLVPEVCQKCGGELVANRRQTRFRCQHCGSKFKLPQARILAEPDRARAPRSAPPSKGRRIGRMSREEHEAERVARARSRRRPGCIGIFLDLLARMFFRLVVHLISTMILLAGIGLIAASAIYGEHWWFPKEYGIGAGVVLTVFSLFFLALAPGPRPRN